MSTKLSELTPGERRQLDAREEKLKSLQRNGITVKDLEDNYRKGYAAALNDSTEMVIRGAYAAALTALHEIYGFGEKRLFRFLTRMDQELLLCIDNDELIENCFRETGLRLVADEGVDRVRELPGKHIMRRKRKDA